MVTLKDLVETAELQLKYQTLVEGYESQLKEAKETLRQLAQETVPNMMAEVGMEEFKLPNGFKVSIKDEVYAKIPESTAYQAFDWLRQNNLDGIVKTQVAVDFGKGEDEEAQRVVDMLTEAGVSASVKSTIHPMTLKAFIKERVLNGYDIPLDVFGATVVKTTVIRSA